MYRKSVAIKRTNSYAHTTHRTKVSAEKLNFSPGAYAFKITMFIFCSSKNFWWSVEYSTTLEYSTKFQLSVKIAIFEQKLSDVPKNRFFQSTRYRYPDPTTEKETSN